MRFLYSLLVALACGSAAADCGSQFRPFAPDFAMKMKSWGVRYSVKKVLPKEMGNLSAKEDRYVLLIKFGKLSKLQFDHIKEYFGGLTEVPYRPERTYEIADFLSPVEQAYLHKSFIPFREYPDIEKWEFEGSFPWMLKNGITASANCWNTVMQMTRMNSARNSDPNYYLYFPARMTAGEDLRADRYSRIVRADEVKSGDVLVILENHPVMPFVVHATRFKSPDFVYDKADSSESDFARIALAQDVINKYRAALGDGFLAEIRRFNEPDKGLLPGKPDSVEPAVEEFIRTLPGMEKYTGLLNFSADFNVVGGGTNPFIVRVTPYQIDKDPITKRARFIGRPQDLAHFRGLPY